MAYIIKCPKCNEIWQAKEDYKKCKCFRCGFEYKPSKIFVADYIWEAMKRTRG